MNNLHFVHSPRSFCLVNVAHTAFVTAFLKNFEILSTLYICTKNADTFVNNHKCVGKVLTNQEMLSAILRSSSCDIFPIIVCEMPSFSQNSLQIAGCLCFLRIHLVNADTLHDLFYPICGRIIFLTK